MTLSSNNDVIQVKEGQVYTIPIEQNQITVVPSQSGLPVWFSFTIVERMEDEQSSSEQISTEISGAVYYVTKEMHNVGISLITIFSFFVVCLMFTLVCLCMKFLKL